MDNQKITAKTCTKCEETLPVQYFYRDPAYADGYKNICKTCNASYARMKKGFRKLGYVDPRILTNITKVCPGCDAEKDLAYFSADKQRVDGRNYYCRACRSKQAADRRAARRAAERAGGAA